MSHFAAANLMLAVHEKKTTAVDLYRPLRDYVAAAYSERDAQAAEDDLQAVLHLRRDLEKPSPSLEVRRDLLLSYCRALAAVEPRFPISPDSSRVRSLTFTWYDAFRPSKKSALSSIHLEKAAVLFDLGAVYSQIALSADRTSAAGLKQACNGFQSSAGAFSFLRDHVAAKAAAAGLTIDLSVECAMMLEKLMLAQAQECFFEKVIGDGKPPGLCSKVAQQVGVYYDEAYAHLNAFPLNQHFNRAWTSHVQLKASQFYAEACYRYSVELHEKEEIAEEIARLKIGLGTLVGAKKSAKGVAQPLLDSVNKLVTNFKSNLERAMKENDRVYLMQIPSASSLASLPRASLVKSTPLVEVLDASKESFFSNIVPDSSTKALSKYSDMVDNIIQTQLEKLQRGSEMARVKFKEMDLPDSILVLEGNISVPLDLKQDVEAVQINGGPSGLEAQIQQLRDLRRVNDELLAQTEELLQREASRDEEFRTQFGTRWTRPQSITLTKSLQERLNRFTANLKQAADSDARIVCEVSSNLELMAILDHRPIESALPSLVKPIISLNENEDSIVGSLKQSLRQLENLRAQSAGLEDMLKEMKRKDDILPKLMSGSGSQGDLFKKEIAKYDQICEEIAQNIEAQERLLLGIQSKNAEFCAVFNLEDYRVSREKSYKQIAAAVAKYREIKDNINEGLKFYATLQDALSNAKEQCDDFTAARNAQCHEMIEDVQRKIAGLDVTADEKTSKNNHSSRVQPSHSQQPQWQSTPLPFHPRQPYEQPRPGCSESHSFTPQPNHQRTAQRPASLSTSIPSPQPPYYHSPTEPLTLVHSYSFPYPAYPATQQPLYQTSAGPQHPPNSVHGEPTYPGWQGTYYSSAYQQQPGPYPTSPYTFQSPYPPQQGGHRRP